MDNDLYQIPTQVGEKKISITIEMSSRSHPSVHFELYKSDCNWMTYWIFEPSFRDICLIAEQLNIRHLEWSTLRNQHDFRAALQEFNPVYSHGVDFETAKALDELCKNGLSASTEKLWGQDGHAYLIELDGFSEKFLCWCILPEEWGILKPVIDILVAYAKLNQKDYGCSIR